MDTLTTPWGTENFVRFQALIDFHSPELASDYVKGFFYSLRDNDLRLAELVPIWEREGKIAFGGPAAQVQGGG
jgi:hypothetical protein